VTLFTVGEETNHRVGDPHCAECPEEYPEPCGCGGLMHAAETDETDTDGTIVVITLCDRCARSDDEEP
jgi:hypothetical protein